MHLLYRSNNFLCERVNYLRHTLFHLLNCLISTASELSHREQGLDYREDEELSWCPSCSNSVWQGWSCGLVHCPGGNTTDPIWRVLATSDGISSWTPLKPPHSNPNPNLECLMSLKNGCSIHAGWSKSSLKHFIRFCGIFPSLKQNFIVCRSSKV